MSDPSLEFVGTATTLLRLGAFTLLTDPNFLHQGQRAYLGKGLFSKRRTEPSLQPEQLPPLDGILLSHLHGDHFDRVAKKKLNHQLPIWTTSHARRRLHSWGFEQATEMPTWSSRTLEKDGTGLTLTAVPGTHSPTLAKPLLPPVMGSVLELDTGTGRPFRLYLSGDTLYRTWLREITDRLGHLDAAVVHLGGTTILGSILVTMDGSQGADLVQLLQPSLTVPIHYDDYTVFKSPLSDFEQEWHKRQMPGQLRLVHRGDTISLKASP